MKRREYLRGDEPEYRFTLDDPKPKLPIRRYGTIQLARWGNCRGHSRVLPRVAFVRQEAIKSGEWAKYHAVPVEIAATYWSFEGAWIHVRQGMNGILMPDEDVRAVCYVVTEAATNYYTNMTGGDWMPVFTRQWY